MIQRFVIQGFPTKKYDVTSDDGFPECFWKHSQIITVVTVAPSCLTYACRVDIYKLTMISDDADICPIWLVVFEQPDLLFLHSVSHYLCNDHL